MVDDFQDNFTAESRHGTEADLLASSFHAAGQLALVRFRGRLPAETRPAEVPKRALNAAGAAGQQQGTGHSAFFRVKQIKGRRSRWPVVTLAFYTRKRAWSREFASATLAARVRVPVWEILRF